jgi:predicted RNA-binding Zn ribbon-like protein
VGPKKPGELRALFVAGHPALDFLNTRTKLAEDFADLLQSDQDVLLWLRQAGFPAPAIEDLPQPLNLLVSARMLRESIRVLVEMRKRSRRGDPSILNSFLAAGPSYRQLVWDKSTNLRVNNVRRQKTAESILAPIAEAAADLLATADFELVKRCENKNCVLWFADQTKSHRRRWCSMELCGNRQKVAAYRTRRRNHRSSRIWQSA